MVSLPKSSNSRTTKNNKRVKISIPVIFATACGFGIGLMVAILYVSSLDDHDILLQREGISRLLPVLSTDYTTEQQQHQQDTPGWHPIHVFYGDSLGLFHKNTEESRQEWFAQVHQDQVVVDLLGSDGYFVDLAANDAKDWSNTLALERHHGWNGLCIEPNPNYWYGLSHRKCTVVGALVGSSVQQVDVKFRGVFGGIVGKMDEKLAKRKREPDTLVEQRYTAPLTQVFEKFHVPTTIDYLSLDVEGAELLIMKDFPFHLYKIKVLTIERPTPPLKQILEANDYVHLKDFAWWGETLWAHKSTGLTPDHPKIQKIPYEGKN